MQILSINGINNSYKNNKSVSPSFNGVYLNVSKAFTKQQSKIADALGKEFRKLTLTESSTTLLQRIKNLFKSDKIKNLKKKPIEDILEKNGYDFIIEPAEKDNLVKVTAVEGIKIKSSEEGIIYTKNYPKYIGHYDEESVILLQRDINHSLPNILKLKNK